MRQNRRMTGIVLLTALVLSLYFGASCKKQAPTAPPTAPKQAAAPQPKAEPASPAQAAQPAAEPAAEAAKPAETTPAPAPAAQPSGAKMVPINIELPKAMFVGTPQDIKVPNLEKPLGKPRPPFLAPEGTVNLARDKRVASSDEEPIIGEIKMITDGDKEAADGCYVELGPKVGQVTPHITIDLEKTCELYAIVVWHYHKQPRVYFDVIVQVSNDPDFVSGVQTVFNNDADNSAGLGVGQDMHYIETAEGKLIDLIAKGSPKARYVRLYSNGNNNNEMNHYIEVEVYGKPVE
jgi:hypothetical protein